MKRINTQHTLLIADETFQDIVLPSNPPTYEVYSNKAIGFEKLFQDDASKTQGFSVRCIKD